MPAPTREALEAALVSAGTWFVILGLIAGIFTVAAAVAAVRQWQLDGRLRPMRALEEQSKQAQIAEANKAAAEANEKAEAERLARIKIEEKLAPRSLSPDQQKAIASRLRPLQGQVVSLTVQGGSPEAARFARQVESVLVHARWTIDPNTSGTEAGMTMPEGVWVEISPKADHKTKEAATALVHALREERIAVTTTTFAPGAVGPAVRIGVGHK